jgi:hypothetical protein
MDAVEGSVPRVVACRVALVREYVVDFEATRAVCVGTEIVRCCVSWCFDLCYLSSLFVACTDLQVDKIKALKHKGAQFPFLHKQHVWPQSQPRIL